MTPRVTGAHLGRQRAERRGVSAHDDAVAARLTERERKGAPARHGKLENAEIAKGSIEVRAPSRLRCRASWRNSASRIACKLRSTPFAAGCSTVRRDDQRSVAAARPSGPTPSPSWRTPTVAG